jgi:hypothetical protein
MHYVAKGNYGWKSGDLPDVTDSIHEAGNVLAAHTHQRAVNKVAIVPELQLANNNSFF